MPIRTIPGTEVQYHLICFDEHGVERPEADGTMLSDTVRLRLANAGITDVFFCSHGWQGDVPAAISQYDKWVSVMAIAPDRTLAIARRPDFNEIIIGLHWPSLPFGDEDMPVNVGVLGSDDGNDIEVEIDCFAASIANTKTAREAIRVILEAARQDDGERETLPSHVRTAYDQLAYEASLPDGSNNPGGAPGEDQGVWDADTIYAQARSNASADVQTSTSVGDAPGLLGGGWLDKLKGLVVAPLQQMSFWKMKDRARIIGEGGVHELLVSLQQAAAPMTHFHLMGHSFGCIVMSATVAGASTGSPLIRPVETLFLVQGALSLWSYAPDIPVARGKAGYFNRILMESLVRGPIVTTQSQFDSAVGNLYPVGAWLKSQMVLDGDEYPKYGGVGTYGIQGIGEIGSDIKMESVTHDYGFRLQHVYNLDSSGIIKNGGGFSGAHSDIAHPEVAHAFWQAVICVIA
jgi:hypothetical protein